MYTLTEVFYAEHLNEDLELEFVYDVIWHCGSTNCFGPDSKENNTPEPYACIFSAKNIETGESYDMDKMPHPFYEKLKDEAVEHYTRTILKDCDEL